MNRMSSINEIGNMLIELARVVPDGIICFFTSYSHISFLIILFRIFPSL